MTDLEIAVAMRKHLLDWAVRLYSGKNKDRRFDFFTCGICNCYHAVTGDHFKWDKLLQKFPALAGQKPEPGFSAGFQWPINDYGFLCRMRAIRKMKNHAKQFKNQ